MQGQNREIESGVVAMGYQNFLITIEMFFGAILLCFAFPHKVYLKLRCDRQGRGIPLQKISSKLAETLNPKDYLEAAVHNFIPTYRKYTKLTNVADEGQEKMANGVVTSNDVDNDEWDSVNDETSCMLTSDNEV